jgi:hypothetical protein
MTSVHSSLSSYVLEIDVPEKRFSSTPPTPTDQVHSILGHGEIEEVVHVHVTALSPLFDLMDPFAR